MRWLVLIVLLWSIPAVGGDSVDGGVDVGMEVDILGTVIPQGAAPDVGAYEYTP